MRSYFQPDVDGKISVFRMVYELDPSIPFLTHLPSSSITEIVHDFGYEKVREEDWRALCDGRLLSWLYSHADMGVCEAVKQLTFDAEYSRTLAYKVLYRLASDIPYDLREANSPEKIGTLLAYDLVQAQHANTEELLAIAKEYVDPDERFHFYAKQQGWLRLLSEADACFDLNSEENRERLSAYDLRTALYRFCRILGAKPVYFLPNGVSLADGRDVDSKKHPQIKTEMRNGGFMQWMSVFYHEDPNQQFEEEYSYERELEQWVLKLGELDPQNLYFRRFSKAIEETKSRVREVRDEWLSARYKDMFFKFGFYGLCGLWVLLVLILGLDDRSYLFKHHLTTIIYPLGGMTGLIIAVRAYFRGYGTLVSMLFGSLGLLSAFITYFILKTVDTHVPAIFHLVVLLLTAVYILIAWYTDLSREHKTDTKFINDALKKEDIKSTLLEPLYYTFKTKSSRYKSSHFSVLDEVDDHIHSLSGESVIHYIMWSLLTIVMIGELCLFSPKLIGWKHQTTKPQQESVK